jgi:hypothetical protein
MGGPGEGGYYWQSPRPRSAFGADLNKPVKNPPASS